MLEDCRPHHEALTKETGAETLFVNHDGNPLSGQTLRYKIENLTLSRLKRRVTPSAFRGIFGYYWLEVRPKDYENLAQVLWTSIPWTQKFFRKNRSNQDVNRYKKSA